MSLTDIPCSYIVRSKIPNEEWNWLIQAIGIPADNRPFVLLPDTSSILEKFKSRMMQRLMALSPNPT